MFGNRTFRNVTGIVTDFILQVLFALVLSNG